NALNFRLIDSDTLIESQYGKKLQNILDDEGYMKLREIENLVLNDVHFNEIILSTGGSAVYSHEAMTVKNFEHAFLTHIHSDHSAGLADLLLTPWVMGRDSKLNLYGPSGLKQMASSILEAFEDDINYRINGTQPSNDVGYKFNFHLLTEGVVYKDKNITVEAFKVPHGTFDDAYGFRLTSQDKVIVFSGDTGPSPTLEEFATNADILVHEVYSYAGFQEKTKDWQKYHQGHHTSTFEVGQIASRAKPKLLLLSHILFWGSTKDEILEEIRSTYSGQIRIAEDLMIIE
ncbi:MBL fold metallo-hydrolase, partial [Pseudomonadota bacterium]|nr:MBL fold metallo-hydrolase [Pseudomonadota bacterium]